MSAVRDDNTILQARKVLSVFSHPNHELAVLGTLGRLGASCLYLTTTYSAERAEETKSGLAGAGIDAAPVFLAHDETAIYGALLSGDSAFFCDLADELAQAFAAHRPDLVLCDAVEFFNPVHDVTLPLVLRARRLSDLAFDIFEVPLLSQGARDRNYEIQAAQGSRADRTVRVRLSDEEAAAKLQAARQTYINLSQILIDEAGIDVHKLSPEDVGTEVLFGPSQDLAEPESEDLIRYHWRGEDLKTRGAVRDVITYRGHYLPVAEHLINV